MKEDARAEEKSGAKVCGVECEIYSRITGYHRPLKHWNAGKTEEFWQRKTFDPAVKTLIKELEQKKEIKKQKVEFVNGKPIIKDIGGLDE
jgi:hypothetical protein